MDKKVILVTGASRGIGRAIAKILAFEGHFVVANYNKSTDAANSLKSELQLSGIDIDIFKCDVSVRDEVKKMVQFVIEKYGRIDVLVNNAGVDKEQFFLDITDEDWDFIMRNNLNSVFYCTQEVVKHMLGRKNGSIINISSIYGTAGGACDVHYSASKAGINGLTRALAKEFGLSNIRVNAIAPGAILTDMTANISDEDWNEVKKEIPLNKIGVPEDIAKCVKWLIDDEYTTGQIIEINGGWNM